MSKNFCDSNLGTAKEKHHHHHQQQQNNPNKKQNHTKNHKKKMPQTKWATKTQSQKPTCERVEQKM